MNNQRRQRPTFFILGAPKCGTTALHSYLSEHPKVFLPALGQDYFSKDLNTRWWPSLETYLDGFPKCGSGYSAIGERSVWYLYSQEAVPGILSFNPEARFIVMVRNPLEMAPALHSELIANGHEHVRSFQEAWGLQEARARNGERIVFCREPKILQYGSVCKLGSQLEKLLRRVPRERVHAIFLEDLKEDPKTVYEGVLRFLGVPADGREDFPVVNVRKRPRSQIVHTALRQLNRPLMRRLPAAFRNRKLLEVLAWISDRNTRPAPREPLSPEFHAELQKYFEADIQLLAKLLNRDLSHWLRNE